MREIKAGPRKPVRYAAKKASVRYNPEDEATAEDLQVAQRPKRVTAAKPDAISRVEVRNVSPQVRAMIPGSVWRQGPFKWDPVAFVTENEKLNDKLIEAKVQNASLSMFLDAPDTPMIYGVAGNPDDSKAKLFAAMLVNAHMNHMGPVKGNVLWHVLYGGFDNKIMKEYDEIDGKTRPSMLVLSNLTPNSTGVKLEKARDLIERFADIPIVVVSAGEDPMSFLTTRLYVPVNGLAYFSDSLIKKRIEVM